MTLRPDATFYPSRLLRSAWVNLDSIWAITLIATGIATLLL